MSHRAQIIRSRANPGEPTSPRLLDIPRDVVRTALTIPSPYFLSRGFGPEVLDRFDAGESAKLRRAVVPLYDDSGTVCIGYTVRSLKPYCFACRRHHVPGVECRWGEQKWGINGGFPKRSYLYNYAAARRSDAPFIFLVEGPPDVWRLSEAGFEGVALLGCDATAEQHRMLADLGRPVWVAFDSDRAGEEARRRLASKWVDFPAIWFRVPNPYKDVGEMPAQVLARAIREQEQAGTPTP